MALLPIIKLGHPTLRKKALPISQITDDIRHLSENMIETMRLNDGIGLAANQVNMLIRMFVIDMKLIDEDLEAQVFINPEILDSSGSSLKEEGCLSIPNVHADVIRPEKISVRYQTLNGDWVEETLEGLAARVFQHEFDHLNGVLFIDRIPPLQRKLIEPQIKKIQGAYSLG